MDAKALKAKFDSNFHGKANTAAQKNRGLAEKSCRNFQPQRVVSNLCINIERFLKQDDSNRAGDPLGQPALLHKSNTNYSNFT